MSALLQDMSDQLFFKVDKPVSGDVVVALYIGNYKTDWELPLLAYALHTAFLKGDDVKRKYLLVFNFFSRYR